MQKRRLFFLTNWKEHANSKPSNIKHKWNRNKAPSSWLVDSGRLTQEKRKFNLRRLKFGELRSVMERAFGMLKARWRIALKRVEQKTSILKRL